ncbi:MAG: nitroreductase, partial [Actinomycetota bacterium]|nr:nitroreductase [Actinomycetota bacterium]
NTHAVAAMLPLGVPVRQLTKLSRRPVEDFTTVDRFDGQPLGH